MPSTRSSNQPRLDDLRPARFDFEAIGTHWRIDIGDMPAGVDTERLRRSVLGRIEKFDRAYSRFRDDSLVTRISRGPGRYIMPEDARPLMKLYRELYDLSAGAVTPLIGRLLADAGYDAAYTLRPGTLRPIPEWDSAMSYEHSHLSTNQQVLLDFGACGKGYIVDLVSALLLEAGARGVCVDAGGDMVWRPATSESAAIRIGLEHPDDTATVIGVARLTGGALCGSAGNRRAWDRFHHVIDPKSMESPRHIRALWVTADTAMLADGLTTALFFVSPDRLQKRYNFEYAILYDDYRLDHSPVFPAEFFGAEKAGN